MQDTERALRLRNNKRRHRARQKEYTAELERKLSQLQGERVQATIEVQLSARKVMHENRRLRDLLHHSGYSDEAIKSWVTRSEDNAENLGLLDRGPCLKQLQDEAGNQIDSTNINDGASKENLCQGSKAQCVTTSTESGQDSRPVRTCSKSSESSCRREAFQTTTKLPQLVEHEHLIGGAALPADETVQTCQQDSVAGQSCLNRSSGNVSLLEASSTKQRIAPCKVLKHLAAHPEADISELSIEPDEGEADSDRVDAGVPCSQAYQMLIRYATTESKFDAVAQALEEGCMPNAAPGGGCKVKNSAVWKALDDLSL